MVPISRQTEPRRPVSDQFSKNPSPNRLHMGPLGPKILLWLGWLACAAASPPLLLLLDKAKARQARQAQARPSQGKAQQASQPSQSRTLGQSFGLVQTSRGLSDKLTRQDCTATPSKRPWVSLTPMHPLFRRHPNHHHNPWKPLETPGGPMGPLSGRCGLVVNIFLTQN